MTEQTEHDRLCRAIEQCETRSATLAQEQAQLEDQLVALKKALQVLDRDFDPADASTSSSPRGPETASEKIALFRSLFRGRQDVYPTRFVSKKTQKAGYAPACHNKFVPALCELPRIKCSDCANQAFASVDDTAVLAHLQGRHVMGVYPLLENDTCWFLAVDFDKSAWRDDVRAFVSTCYRHELSVAIERSRSGNGAHVWFFFKTPILARIARQMGSYLITETMAGRHELTWPPTIDCFRARTPCYAGASAI